MKIIIQKMKQYFSNLKQNRQQNKQAKKEAQAFSRMDALKGLLIKTQRGYDATIQQLETKHSKALLDYKRKYQQYQDTLKSFTKGAVSEDILKSDEEAVKPFEEAVTSAGEELSTAEAYKRDDVQDLLNQIHSETESYINQEAEKIKLEAVEAQHLKQQYFAKLKGIAERYGAVTELDKLLSEASNSIGKNHTEGLGELISDLTKEAPLTAKDISLDADAVIQKLKSE